MTMALLIPLFPAGAAENTVLSVLPKTNAALGGYVKRGETNQLGTITLTATAGNAQISRLSLTISGTGDPKFIERVQLANAEGKPVGTAGKLQGNTVHFTGLGPLALREGESRSFGLLMEIAPTAPLGKSYGLAIDSPNAIAFTGGAESETKAGSAFPIELLPLPVSDAKNEVFLRAGFLSETDTRKYFPIDKEMTIATLEIAAFGGDITISELRLKKDGDLNEKYLRDLTIVEAQKTVPLGGFTLSGSLLVFDTPIMVKEGQTLRLGITTTIPVEAGELKNFFFEIDPKTDLVAKSADKIVPVITDRVPLRTRQMTVIAPSISMWRSWLSPKARHLQPGTKDVVLMEIEVQSTTDDVALKQLAVRVDSGIDALRNLRLLKKPGLRINEASQTGTEFLFQNPGTLAAGKIENFQLIADLSPSARIGETIEIAVPKQELAEGLPTYALEIRGNPIVIGRSTEAKLQFKPAYRPVTVLAGSRSAPLLAFEVSVTDSPAEITELVFQKQPSQDSTAFTNFLLKDASGNLVAKGDDNGDRIRFAAPFGIAENAPQTLTVTADVSASAADTAITLSLTDHRGITAKSLLSGKPAVVDTRFPLASLAVTAVSPPSERIGLIVENSETTLAFPSRGIDDYEIGRFSLRAIGDDLVVDRLLFTREGELKLGLDNLRLIGDNGFVATGRLSDATLIFDTPLHLDRDAPVIVRLVTDLAPNAERNRGARFALSGAEQIRLRQASGKAISVFANFPMVSGEVRISAAGESCAKQNAPVCGRDYRNETAVFTTFPDRCALDAARAILVHEGACTETEGVAPESESGFSDVPPDHPYAEAIASLKTAGVINGTGNGQFAPENALSRAELIKILVSARFDQNEINACISTHSARSVAVFFPDVPADSWFAPFVCVAKVNGWIQGDRNGDFLPHDKIATADAAKMIVNAYRAGEFTDGKPWFEPYVEFLAENNALPATVIGVDATLTRAETAEMIWRLEQDITDRPSREYDTRRNVLR